MKTKIYFWTILLACILFAGCSSQEKPESTGTKEQAQETTTAVNNESEKDLAESDAKLQLMENKKLVNILQMLKVWHFISLQKISQIHQIAVEIALKTGLLSTLKILPFRKDLIKKTSERLLALTLVRNKRPTRAIRFTTS